MLEPVAVDCAPESATLYGEVILDLGARYCRGRAITLSRSSRLTEGLAVRSGGE